MMTENSKSKDGYILIDPPITTFSAKKDILAWIEKLKTFPDSAEVQDAITEAQGYIIRSKTKDNNDKQD